MTFIGFMASSGGRWLRIAVGVALVVIGALVGGTAGAVFAIVGLVPVAAGVGNICLVAPLFHAPVHGTRLF